MVVLTILVQYTFRQYRGHSLRLGLLNWPDSLSLGQVWLQNLPQRLCKPHLWNIPWLVEGLKVRTIWALWGHNVAVFAVLQTGMLQTVACCKIAQEAKNSNEDQASEDQKCSLSKGRASESTKCERPHSKYALAQDPNNTERSERCSTECRLGAV